MIYTLDIYQLAQQMMNDFHEHVLEHENFNLEIIEKIIIINLLNKKMTQEEMSELLGISVRTIRNKMEIYGLKAIRPNLKLLQSQTPNFDAFKTPRGSGSALSDGLDC